MATPSWRRFWAHTAFDLVVALVVLLLGACTDDDPSPSTTEPAPTTTAPSTTLSQEDQDEQALRDLAEEWFEATDRIYSGAAEAQEASLYITDPYLAGFLEQIRTFRESGNSIRTSERTSHLVEGVSADGDSASVSECVVDADVLLGPDGEVINDLVVTKRYRTSAARTEDGWRFEQRETVSEIEGRAECDS